MVRRRQRKSGCKGENNGAIDASVMTAVRYYRYRFISDARLHFVFAVAYIVVRTNIFGFFHGRIWRPRRAT